MNTTAAAVADIVCEAAPVIASVLADLLCPSLVQVTYSARQVTITAPPHWADATFDRMIVGFEAAGWGFTTRYTDNWVRIGVSFQPPWTLTQHGRPVGGAS